MNLVVRPAAAADIEDAYRWYRDKGRELGVAFLGAVREAGARIVENPEAYAVFHRAVRRIRLKRFPYSLLYRLYPELIVVVACLMAGETPCDGEGGPMANNQLKLRVTPLACASVAPAA